MPGEQALIFRCGQAPRLPLLEELAPVEWVHRGPGCPETEMLQQGQALWSMEKNSFPAVSGFCLLTRSASFGPLARLWQRNPGVSRSALRQGQQEAA